MLSSLVSDIGSHSLGCLITIIIKDSDNFSLVEGCFVGQDFCYFN